MAQKTLNCEYYDLKEGVQRNAGFFFLESILKARIALNIKTGVHDYDEEVNVYIANLLLSFMTSDAIIKTRSYVSAYDDDVRQYLDSHPGARNEYTVYKENADFGLIAESVFLGYDHPGSYHSRVMSNQEECGKIAAYYELAASALAHLACAGTVLVQVLAAIADNYIDIVKLLRKAAGDYFDFIERISDGELFHLEHEIALCQVKTNYDRRLDEFLKAYFDYTCNPTELGRVEVLKMTAELKKLNSSFNFDESKLNKHR